VIGVYHPKWDERPLLIVQLKGRAQKARRARTILKIHGRQGSPKWWMPDDVAFVEGIPHTANWKDPSKTALRDQFQGLQISKTRRPVALEAVMAGLVPAIHVPATRRLARKTRFCPGMTFVWASPQSP